MPRYSYICECGEKIEVVRPMSDSGLPWKCLCGKSMKRDFKDEAARPAGIGSYHRSIHSDSLAIVPSQVAEHQRMFPNIKLDSECRPIFDSYKEHDDYLKKCNVEKVPQKIKRRFAPKKAAINSIPTP